MYATKLAGDVRLEDMDGSILIVLLLCIAYNPILYLLVDLSIQLLMLFLPPMSMKQNIA
jgi:hypothetical protein